MDRDSLSQPRFDCALIPHILERGMFARNVDPPVGRHDLLMQKDLLPGIE
jgi:hypothetical protein